ncbi:hypothetical protein [Nocardioides sediminis]|uniref:hypothetical protein n=1 Tax=Nocardioides sediminis TaxID=433648 RepID=UPI000D31FFEA|nr:hypothetical protein [Nocardioides sediminis]
MSSEQIWLAAGGAVALLLLLTVLVLATVVRRSSRSRADLAERVAALEATVGALQAARVPEPRDEPASYVITAVADDGPGEPETSRVVEGRIDGALFADIVARESVIKAAGLAHGLRRALAPEARNRIRFEVRQETRRSRKQRRADLKAALRDMQARERARTQAQTAERGDEGDAA